MKQRKVRIHSPVVNGFFIADTSNNVWDGENWRGFGCPEYYKDFQDAFRASKEAARK